MRSRRPAALRLALLAALLPACGDGAGPQPAPAAPVDGAVDAAVTVAVDAGERQHGVAWVAGGPVTREHLAALREHGVTWISQTPFGWQRGVASPEVELVTTGVYWGETDEGLATTTRLARELGIRTLLKPHVWLRDAGDGWLGDVAMESDADWERWFASYRRFLLHYARLAETHGIEALAVGTELRRTVRERPADWRRLVAEVRDVYGGRLTYAANWYGEVEEVPFWDALDWIGVQGYYPLLAEGEEPTLDALLAGWAPHAAVVERLAARWRRPVVFTEIGYRATVDAAVEPWQWNEHSTAVGGDAGRRVQALAYEAFFRTFWPRPWVAGAYVWKWYPRPEIAEERDFTPQGNPASDVLARWYGATPPSGDG